MEIRESEKATEALRRLHWVALAQAGALLLYALLVEVLLAAGFTPPVLFEDPAAVRAGLVAVSVGLFIASGQVRDRMLRPRFEALEQALVPGERLRRMTTANVVAFALCDAVAILGLCFFLLGGGRIDFYLFTALAGVFMAIRFPRAHQWQAWYAQRARLR